MTQKKKFKSGYLAIIGRPNVGKSTLLNRLLNFKLSITSPKPQTTRRRVMGIMTGDNHQIIFLDTPGMVDKPKYHLHRAMFSQIQAASTDADALLYMIDDATVKNCNDLWLDYEINPLVAVNPLKKPVLLIINKIDLLSKDLLLPAIKAFAGIYPFREIIPVSAKKNDGIDRLLPAFLQVLPSHPPFYNNDVLTEQPERFFVAELIREQIFFQYQEEIPYATEVQIEEFTERVSSKDYIRAIIYTERKSQKGIIIGSKGVSLREIGRRARMEIERFLGREVFLDLHVKVKDRWRKDPGQLQKFGYN